MASKMASYVTGYEDERFEHAVSQSFHCIICTNVFKDPVMCRHNEHLFCRSCITIHLTNSQTCPTCMEPLTINTLTQAPRGIRNLLSELKIRCEFFDRGCGTFVELGDLEKHVADCGFAPAICSNQGCLLEVNKQDLIHHETAVCKLRRVRCHNGKELSQEIDAMKVSLAALNEKLDRNEKQMSGKLQKIGMNSKAAEQNLVAKFELVQGQLNSQGENIRHVQGDLVGITKSLNQIIRQLDKMTELVTRDVLAEQKETKKEFAEASNMDSQPKIVIAGGKDDDGGVLNSVEMFSLSTQTWTPLQRMTERRSVASSVVYNNQVVVIGGTNDRCPSNSMEGLSTNAVYSDQSLTWKRLPVEIPGRLQGHCSVVYNGRLIVIGGYEEDTGAFSDRIIEVSLVPPFTSKLLTTMPRRISLHSISIFCDKIVIVGGCYSFKAGSIVSAVTMYDITKNKCTELAPLPYPVCEMATVKWGDDNVIVIGGADWDSQPLSNVLMYNIKTQESHVLPDMRCMRKGCVAAVVRDTVVVMGGVNYNTSIEQSVESFRFDRYSWDELPDMHEGRYLATAVVC